MQTTIEYEGLTCFKTNKKNDPENGPQKRLIRESTSSNIYKIVHYRHGHMWTIIQNRDVHKYLNRNIGLYEVIPSRYHRKVFFDFEVWDIPDCLEKATKLIMEWLPDAQLNISGSIQDTSKYNDDDIRKYFKRKDGTVRYSYHIIVNNYYFDNWNDQKCLESFCNHQTDVIFDTSVYSTDQTMKCINQAKEVKWVGWSVFEQKYISGSENITDHLINNFFPEDAKNALEVFEVFSKDVYETTRKINKEEKNKKIPINVLKDLKNIQGLELASLFPVDIYNKNRHLAIRICMYCIKYSINFSEFWSWALNYGFTDEKDWERQFMSLCRIYTTDTIFVTHSCLLRKLRVHYPHIYKEYYSRLYAEFADVHITRDIRRRYLSSDDLITDKQVIYLATQMGTGKTEAILDDINKKDGINVLFLTCRRSLASSVKDRSKDFVHYQDYKRLKTNLVSKNILKSDNQKISNSNIQKLGLKEVPKLIITPNSIHYLEDKKYDIIIIDEVELYLFCWTAPGTHSKKFEENWNIIKNMLLASNKIFILDALPSYKTIRYLERIGISESNIEIIGSTVCAPKIPIVDVKGSARTNAISKFFKKIVKDIHDGLKIYIFWPNKKNLGKNDKDKSQRYENLSGEDINQYIKSQVRRNVKSYVYNGSVDKSVLDTLENVNENWYDVDYIITNQVITVGVNCNVPFDNIYIADKNYISIREIVQTTRRVRTIRGKVFYINLKSDFKVDYLDTVKIYKNKEITETVEDVCNELRGRSEENVKMTYEKAGYEWIIDEDSFIDLPRVMKEQLGLEVKYLWPFIYIPEDENIYDIIKNRIVCGVANQEEYLVFDKIKFCKLFSKEDWRSLLDDNTMANLWYSKSFVEKYIYAEDWIHDINYNAMEGIFDVSSENKIKMINLLVNRVTLSEKSSGEYLVYSFLNAYFGSCVITIKKQSRHYVYNYSKDTASIVDDIEYLLEEETTKFRDD